MKTRDELKAQGILLEGDIVPDWFKRRADGCSVPTRTARFFFRAITYKAPCFIHDWDYYKANLCFEPDSEEWKVALRLADRRLKHNIRLIQRWPLRSWFHGKVYYAGIRIGGRKAAHKKSQIKDIWCPPSIKDIVHLRHLLDNQHLDTARWDEVHKFWFSK